jgi:curved DNA-binding protein
MKKRDYYEILGVPKSASSEDIQRAYRRLARSVHPDVSKDKDAERKFKELNEARDTLKDPEKRDLYDRFGHHWQQTGEPHHTSARSTPGRGRSKGAAFSGSSEFDGDHYGQSSPWQEVVEELFRSSGSGGGEWVGEPEAFAARQTVETELVVSLAEVVRGATKIVSLQSFGVGEDGRVRPMHRTLQVRIPRGIKDGAMLRLAGQGGATPSRSGGGDLYLRIRVAPDPQFTRDGDDLLTVVAVSPWEAVLGATISVRTLDGTVTVRVPKGSQNGQRLRLRGKGLPRGNTTSGDLLVELEIRVPEAMDGEVERLFREMAKTSRFNPRDTISQKGGRSIKGESSSVGGH